jgi:uncharacterized phiE125 gp8 family phage protein
MWYPASITVAAAAEPITLGEAQDHLRADLAVEEAHVRLLIASARAHVEAYCGVRFATQTVTAKCDSFADMARLPEAPVQSVTSISYVDTAGTTQTLSTDVYELRADGLDAAVVLKYGQTWPATQPGSRITVVAVVGTETIPPPVKLAMLLHLGQSYEQRENAKAEGWTALDSLLCNYRRSA